MKKFKAFGVLIGIATTILGFLFLLKPVQMEEIIVIIIGVSLLVSGAIKVIETIIIRKDIKNPILWGAPGVAMIILGVIVLVYPGIPLATIGVIIAISAFFLGFDRFTTAIEKKKAGESFAVPVICGIIHTLFGIFMMYGTFAMLTALVMVVGIYLLTAGIMIILSALLFKDL